MVHEQGMAYNKSNCNYNDAVVVVCAVHSSSSSCITEKRRCDAELADRARLWWIQMNSLLYIHAQNITCSLGYKYSTIESSLEMGNVRT